MQPISSSSVYSSMERTSLPAVGASLLLVTEFLSVCLQRYGKDFSVTGLDKENQIATLSSGKKIQYDALISTMPLDITLTWLDKKQWADGLTHRCRLVHSILVAIPGTPCCKLVAYPGGPCCKLVAIMRHSSLQALLLGCATTAVAYSVALTAYPALCGTATQQKDQAARRDSRNAQWSTQA